MHGWHGMKFSLYRWDYPWMSLPMHYTKALCFPDWTKADPENDPAVHRMAERCNAFRKPDFGTSVHCNELSADRKTVQGGIGSYFFLIGIWLIVRALHMRDPLERREDAFAWRQLCIWAMLTSVDSFLTGIGMGFLDTRVTAQIIQLAIMAALAVIVGIYAGYRIGCHGRNRVLISGALIFLLAGVDVLFRYYI